VKELTNIGIAAILHIRSRSIEYFLLPTHEDSIISFVSIHALVNRQRGLWTKDHFQMDDSSDPPEDYPASTRGIINCLRMLAEEAGGLRLNDTAAALQRAITVCTAECEGFAPFPPDLDTVEIRRRSH
jgi:hypothetical protein